MIISKTQDVEPIIKANKERQKYNDWRLNDFTKVASIPWVVWKQWQKEGYDVNDMECLKQLLNDPNNKFLKTIEGQI